MAIAPPAAQNGRPRKQLSDQLDRLDEVINGMEECLPQAVADRDGIRLAFRDILRELVADPATLDGLRTSLTADLQPLAPKQSAFARLKTKMRNAAAKVVNGFRIAKVVAGIAKTYAVSRLVQRCTAARTRVARWTLLALPVKSILGISLAIGFVVAMVSLAAPHHIAAKLSGFGATLTAVTVQISTWLRRQRALLGMT